MEQNFLQGPCLKGARLRIAEENPVRDWPERRPVCVTIDLVRLVHHINDRQAKTSRTSAFICALRNTCGERVRTLVAVMALSSILFGCCETHGAALIMIRHFPLPPQ
jgi:hypothetical protein